MEPSPTIQIIKLLPSLFFKIKRLFLFKILIISISPREEGEELRLIIKLGLYAKSKFFLTWKRVYIKKIGLYERKWLIFKKQIQEWSDTNITGELINDTQKDSISFLTLDTYITDKRLKENIKRNKIFFKATYITNEGQISKTQKIRWDK